MKPLIKYPATLIVLLLVAYTQVFARAYRVDFLYTSAKTGSEKNHIQTPAGKTTSMESTYFEEEETRRIFLKHCAKDNTAAYFFSIPINAISIAPVTVISFFGERFSRLTSFRASLFRVLRL